MKLIFALDKAKSRTKYDAIAKVEVIILDFKIKDCIYSLKQIFPDLWDGAENIFRYTYIKKMTSSYLIMSIQQDSNDNIFIIGETNALSNVG